MTGVDDMSTQDVFGYFKEYPPAHIEWIDDASCECITHTHTHALVTAVVVVLGAVKDRSTVYVIQILRVDM